MNIKHVKGNLLRLAIPLTIITKTTDGGQETSITEDFIPNINYPITVRLGGSYLSYSFDATMDGNIAIMEDNGTLPKGVYQVEVLCKDDNGNNCRFMQRSVIDVVDATIEAGIVIGTEFEVETHYLDAAVFIRGEKGEKGDTGEGVPSGGTTGQVLSKKSATDYDTRWVNPPAAGVNSINGKTGDVTLWASDVGALPDDTAIPDAVTEQTVSGWGFTKNTGTYSKPSGGIPPTDLSSDVQTSLGKADTALQSFTETDPTVPQWAKQTQKPTYTAQEVGALPNITKYGSTIDLDMDSATYVLTLALKDQDGTVLNTKTVDLPIESVVVNGRYDAANKKIVLILQSGSTIDVPVGDLIAGLQTEITSVNTLDADLVDDTNSTHKFVTAQDKTNWNNKSDFSGSYNDLSNKPTIPAAQVQSDWNATTGMGVILNKPTIPDVSGKEDKTNKVTSLSSSSTDTQYPSAKCVYDMVGNIETLLAAI